MLPLEDELGFPGQVPDSQIYLGSADDDMFSEIAAQVTSPDMNDIKVY